MAASSNDATRIRFNEVSDAARLAYAEGREADARTLLQEFFALQLGYLRGTVYKEILDSFRDRAEDAIGFIAVELITALQRGQKLHWHMLWSTYNNKLIDYYRRQGKYRDLPARSDDHDTGLGGDPVHGRGNDAEREPDAAAHLAGMRARIHDMYAELKAGPRQFHSPEPPPAGRDIKIRNPDRIIDLLDRRMIGFENTAEIARDLGVNTDTLRREWNEFLEWARHAFSDLRDFLDIVEEGKEEAS